ncbi:hypothetical protein J1N35_039881 [Gossypium stocksii]|uniref:Uncharacterized protein n=1 Tax=Gossypium stocksii TaxID=47602 RepID=A0A9D3UD50_9ROSI|nr:hypothetical protein J1N35_039881 [Gossypium stocksii]
MASSLSLSQNTLFDILSRLPLKSVTRFKFLPKDWAYLTLTPTFVADHLLRSSSNSSLLLFCYNTQPDFDFGILLITNLTHFTCRPLVFPLEEPLPFFSKIMGSIDCLEVNDGDAKYGCGRGGDVEIVGIEKKKHKHIRKFKFGTLADGSTFNHGSCASSPFSFSSPAPSLVPSNCQSSSSATATKNDTSAATVTSASATTNASISFTSSPSVEASIPSFTGAPVFKFSSSGDLSTLVSTLSATSGEATESKTQDTKLGNVGIFPFGSTSAFIGSGSSIFCGTSAASSFAGTTAEVASSGNSSSSGISSTITNSGSAFFSSTFSPVTSTSNGIIDGTSATTSTGNVIFGGTSATTSTGNGIFGGTSATSTGSSIFGGTSLPVSGTGSMFSTKSAGTTTGSNVFEFSAPATSTSNSQCQGLNPFNAVNTQASAAGTGIVPQKPSL